MSWFADGLINPSCVTFMAGLSRINCVAVEPPLPRLWVQGAALPPAPYSVTSAITSSSLVLVSCCLLHLPPLDSSEFFDAMLEESL